MSNLYNQVVEFVDQSFGKKKSHYPQTLYWLLKLKPDADEAMKVAAYSHDIQRAFIHKSSIEQASENNDGFKNKEFLTIHQQDGAKIIAKFLKQQHADAKLIKKVKHLVSKHEVGGDEAQNILKDADSLSFFETNAPRFATEYVKTLGKDKIKQKLNWMFERITSEQAKNWAKPMYEKALVMLNNS